VRTSNLDLDSPTVGGRGRIQILVSLIHTLVVTPEEATHPSLHLLSVKLKFHHLKAVKEIQ
jgi:hypothetical protein